MNTGLFHYIGVQPHVLHFTFIFTPHPGNHRRPQPHHLCHPIRIAVNVVALIITRYEIMCMEIKGAYLLPLILVLDLVAAIGRPEWQARGDLMGSPSGSSYAITTHEKTHNCTHGAHTALNQTRATSPLGPQCHRRTPRRTHSKLKTSAIIKIY